MIKRIIKDLKEEIREKYKAEIIGIFGSYARGEQNSNSDIDVLVKFESDANLIHLMGLSFFLEEKLNIKVDVVPYESVREEIKEQVYKETIYL